MIPVIDIFAGPGGLGEGFAAFQVNDQNIFHVSLSIEKDPIAFETLFLRHFYRHCAMHSVPEEYYSFLRGSISKDSLYKSYPAAAAAAERQCWKAELGKTPWSDLSHRIGQALNKSETWVLIGGPPCQAYSLVGRSRRKSIKTYDPETDERTRLYREYLQIIANYWPAVFVMENVKGLLSHRQLEEKIFDRIIQDLIDPASAVSSGSLGQRRHRYKVISLTKDNSITSLEPTDYIVRAEEFGIPQARHRVVLLGIREDLTHYSAAGLTSCKSYTPAASVIKGLPRLRSGLSKQSDTPVLWQTRLREATERRWFKGIKRAAGLDVEDAILEILTSLSLPRHDRGKQFIECGAVSQYERAWFEDRRLNGVCNHETRSHIIEDLYRYLFASSFAQVYHYSPKLSDFPPDLLPKHENVLSGLDDVPFSDRFRVQLWEQPSTTVTAHISKDGHYYIHPDPTQCRSLTVREAARLQTFPDNYFFLGPRTGQYIQVGNAVPPLLAKQIAELVHNIISKQTTKEAEYGQDYQRTQKLEHESHSVKEYKTRDSCPLATPSTRVQVPATQVRSSRNS